MLDFLSDDIKQLRNKVPSAEQDKLSHYLLAFEELQERRKKLLTMSKAFRNGAPKLTE